MKKPMEFHEFLSNELMLDEKEYMSADAIEKEVYRRCIENLAEGNVEEGEGYWDNYNDMYGDYLNKLKETITK